MFTESGNGVADMTRSAAVPQPFLAKIYHGFMSAYTLAPWQIPKAHHNQRSQYPVSISISCWSHRSLCQNLITASLSAPFGSGTVYIPLYEQRSVCAHFDCCSTAVLWIPNMSKWIRIVSAFFFFLLWDHPGSGASALIHVNHVTILWHVINYITVFSGLNKHLLFVKYCLYIQF